jgi:hypothetical protein
VTTTTYIKCRRCGREHAPTTAMFCDVKCQGDFMRASAEAIARRRQRDAVSEAAAVSLLTLHARRDRCSTHWERAQIDVQIGEINARSARIGLPSVTDPGG